MFANLILYRIGALFAADLPAIEEALSKTPFAECLPSQERSAGWVPPRGEAHGALVESVGGQWIARYKIESKAIPADVLRRRVDAKAEAIEQATGRRPGKKERRELQDEAKLDLLPFAFPRQAAAWVWIDPGARLLAIDTSNQGRADEIATALVEALPGLSLALLDTKTSPQAAMAHWLREQEPPAGFSIDRECELKSGAEDKAVVRYGRHPLDIDEVRQHIEAGKLPTRLALTWDDRVSFVLTEGLQLKKVQLLDVVLEGGEAESGFDADVAIATGELVRLVPDLIAALGGEGRADPERAEAPQEKEAPAWHGATDGPDPLYEQAAALVRGEGGKASTSFVQRKLAIGYNRAARLLEAMEQQGLVSAMNAAGAREVLA